MSSNHINSSLDSSFEHDEPSQHPQQAHSPQPQPHESHEAASTATATINAGATSSWQTLRMIGRQHYENGQYDAAYYAFQNGYTKMKQQQQVNTTTPIIPNEELQFLLSNIIACRIQIGGIVHLEKAIVESKECIAKYPTWSTSYIRLASSYMALRAYQAHRSSTSNTNRSSSTTLSAAAARPVDENYSNDICNALQTAIRYENPNHINTTKTAKQMLRQELQLRNQNPNRSTTTTTNPPPMNPNYIPSSSSTPPISINHEASGNRNINHPPIPLEGFPEIDPQNNNETDAARRHDSHHREGTTTNLQQQQQWRYYNEYGIRMLQSTRHKINIWFQQLQVQYHSLPRPHQRAMILLLLFLSLLLSLRFIMLLSSRTHPMDTRGRRSRPMKGNYGHDNIYEQIRREKLQQQQQSQYYSSNHHHHPPNQRASQYQQYNDHHQSNKYDPSRQQHYYSRSRRSSSSLEVNGMIYIGLIAVAVYIGHVYFGIHPWQMILLLRMVQNGGGGGGGFMWYNGGGYGRGARHAYRRRGYW